MQDDRDLFRGKPCLICGEPSDPCHVKSQKVNQGQEWLHTDTNLMNLCRYHHSEQHALGILTFALKHLPVWAYLYAKGWRVNEIGRLSHPLTERGDHNVRK